MYIKTRSQKHTQQTQQTYPKPRKHSKKQRGIQYHVPNKQTSYTVSQKYEITSNNCTLLPGVIIHTKAWRPKNIKEHTCTHKNTEDTHKDYTHIRRRTQQKGRTNLTKNGHKQKITKHNYTITQRMGIEIDSRNGK